MAKVRFTGGAVLLAGAAVVLASCGGAIVQRSALVAAAPRPWVPQPVALAPRLLDAPPALAPTPPEKDPAVQLIHQSQHNQSLLRTERLMEEFRAQELELWKQGPAISAQRSEPLLLEDVLRLNIQDDPRVSPELQKLLLATKSDLPLTLNEHVLRFVNYFRGRGANTLRASWRRSGSYRDMISRILAEEGVPQDLIYLVQAESGFRPGARSSKKATGMWQFVAGRGREYGLNQNRQVDERLDPEKATRAAARHLADLYTQFGNWYLAMAAYNCGPGGVQRAVERTGYADYWEFVRRGVLPRETANYVPAILAMALLAKNADAFRLNDVVPENRIDYDTVQTRSRISVNLIADATGASLARIKQLNPALLGRATPDGPYALRIPKDSVERFEQEIAAVPEARRQSWRRHQVRSGETLTQIAAQYKVKVQEISMVNQLGSGGLKAGERITIPVPFRPEVVRTAARTPAGAAPARASTAAAAGSGRTHLIRYRVRSGDTLGIIAGRYRVRVAQIQGWNHMRGSRLQAGQVLSIWAPGAGPAPTRAAAGPAPAGVTN
ncbi:MAG: transglycosylase SLT domain-containing protein [Acidobacteria bacterium]|nr:transglycosylase SLT domain-containing protein [Acidobacteriota bacterium]